MTVFSNCSCCTPTPASTGPALARRTFIAGGIAALGLGSIGAPTVRAQTAKTKIDVHHHFLPPAHREAQGKCDEQDFKARGIQISILLSECDA